MNRFLVSISISLITSCFTAVSAQAASFSVTSANDPNTLINKLLGDTTGLDTSTFQAQTLGNAQAFGTFQNDPFNLTSGIVLSTGKVTDLPGKNRCYSSCTDASTDFPVGGVTNDRIQFRFDFVNNTADNLYFQYVFGSEELPEWAGTVFNDKFSLQLNGQNLAYLSDGSTTVNTNNLARSTDLILSPPGSAFSNETKLDGFSKPLLFTGTLKKNNLNTLLVTVEDGTDGIYDSAVFLKAGTLSTVLPPDITGVPTGCSAIPIVGNTGSRGGSVPLPVDSSGTPNCTNLGNIPNGNPNGNPTTTTVPEGSSIAGTILMGLFLVGFNIRKCLKMSRCSVEAK